MLVYVCLLLKHVVSDVGAWVNKTNPAEILPHHKSWNLTSLLLPGVMLTAGRCTGQDNPMLRHLELQWRKECLVQASTVEPSAFLLLRNTTAHNKACPGAKVVAVFLLLFAELSSRPDISVIHVRWSCTV